MLTGVLLKSNLKLQVSNNMKKYKTENKSAHRNNKSVFEPVYVNPSRRDLLKKIAILGSLGISGLGLSSFVRATISPSEIASIATWKSNRYYEDFRKSMLFKGNKPKRYPDVIVQPKNESEIKAALQFANDNDLQVVCRGSGHNTAAAILRNGGMLLDLSAMNAVYVDHKSKTAKVQTGAIMAYFHAEIAKYGLAFPNADCHTVALGGYILGGGHGRNSAFWSKGPACNSLLEAEVLLGTGEKVVVNKDNYTDMFWAIRGCGPAFFGIILNYTLQLFDEVGATYRSSYTYPANELPAILKFFDQLEHNKDERVSTRISFRKAKNSGDKPKVIVSITAIAEQGPNADENAKALINTYVAQGIADKAISKRELVKVEGVEMFTPNRQLATNTDNINTDDSSALLALLDHFADAPADCRLSLGMTHNGHMHANKKDCCYSAKGKHFISFHTLWQPGEDDNEVANWEAKFKQLMQPYCLSHYINQTDNERYPEHIMECFSEENWERLARVRSKYDPNSRFYTYLGYS